MRFSPSAGISFGHSLQAIQISFESAFFRVDRGPFRIVNRFEARTSTRRPRIRTEIHGAVTLVAAFESVSTSGL
jgi:hypothetical protein